MDPSVASRTFFSETIRSMYRIYGYEALMKEVLFIHHHSHLSAPAPVPVPVPVPVVSETDVVKICRPVDKGHSESLSVVTINKVEDSKNEEEEEDKKQKKEDGCIKYSRTHLPDESRCTATLNNKERCAIRRAKSDTMCHRHKVAREKEQEEQEQEQEQEQAESSDS